MVVCHCLLQAPKETSEVLHSYPREDMQGLAESYLLLKGRRKEVGHSMITSLPTFIFVFSFRASILGLLIVKFSGSVYFEISYPCCHWQRLHHRFIINKLLIIVHDMIYMNSAVSSEKNWLFLCSFAFCCATCSLTSMKIMDHLLQYLCET